MENEEAKVSLREAAECACEAAGVTFRDVPVDGRFYSLSVTNKGRRNYDGRILFFPDNAGGIVWNHTTGESVNFWAREERILSHEAVEARKLRAQREREEAERRREAERQRAALTANEVWENSVMPVVNPYLLRKRIEPTPALREIDLGALLNIVGYHPQVKGNPISGKNILVVPIRDPEGKIASIEMIDEAGRKPALRYGKKSGCFWATGNLPDGDGRGTVIGIGEGVATVLTWHAATAYLGIAALSCGNLKAVAQTIRKKFPLAHIVIISDLGNGEKDAQEAAQVTKSILLLPDLVSDSSGTDLNDMHVERGLPVVTRHIESVMAAAVSSTGHTRSIQLMQKDVPFQMSTLLDKEFPPINWAISDLLPEGLAILAGPPKIGKSWMIMDVCLSMASAGYALNYFQAPYAEALYLSLEDNERRLKERVEKLLKSYPDADLSSYHCRTEWSRLDDGGLENLDAWLLQHRECRLVVIDTFQKIKGRSKSKNATLYELDYEALGALQRLALARQCCILLIHHTRKTTSMINVDPLEAISGSTGITGTVDTILMLSRPRGTSGAVLTVTGRDVPDAEYSLTFDKDNCSWSVSGTGPEIGLQEGSNPMVILNALKNRPSDFLTIQEIAEGLGGAIKLSTVKTVLYRLAGKGLLENRGGKFGYVETGKPLKLETSPAQVFTTLGEKSTDGLVQNDREYAKPTETVKLETPQCQSFIGCMSNNMEVSPDGGSSSSISVTGVNSFSMAKRSAESLDYIVPHAPEDESQDFFDFDL